jgi:hypothetical protein
LPAQNAKWRLFSACLCFLLPIWDVHGLEWEAVLQVE